jgi:PAS domain S-box-containing protein
VAQKETMTQQEMAILTAQEVKENNSTSFQIDELERTKEALRRSQDETGHARRLLLAFSQAAQAVQRARTPDEVYHTVGEEVARLGYHAMVFSLTTDRASLTISHTTFGPILMQAAAKLTGLSVQDYRMPLVPGGFFQWIIAEGQAIFADRTRTAEIIAEGLPGPLRPLVSRLAAVVGIEQGIVTRVTVGGEAHGVLIITGTDLTEADVPAVTAFASQTAIALENARAAEELRKGEERYRAFIVATAQVVWTTNAGGEVVVDSPVWREFTGQSEEALKGWGWIEAIHPDDRERAAQAWIKAVEAKSPYENELRVRKYDGSYRLFLARAIPVLEADGSIREWVGTCTDITERKQAEEALREKEQRYRSLAESSPDAIFILDRDERVIYGNQTSAQWLGRPVAELVGQRQADLFPAKTARHQSESLQRVLATGKAERREESTPFPGGVRWIETRLVPLLGPNDAVESVMGVSRDVTERKRAEEALKKYSERLEEMVEERTAELKTANEQLRLEITERKQVEEALQDEKALMDALMDNITDSIYFKDRQCRLTRINRKMMQDLNLDDTSQGVGKTDVDLFGEEFGRKTLADDQRVMATGEPIMGLIESRQLEDGQINWTLTTKVPLRDASGQIVGLAGITREINELIRAEQSLQESKGRLTTILDSLQTGVAIIDAETHVIVDANPAAVDMIGAHKERIVGQVCHKFICPAEVGKCPITDLGQTIDKSERVLINANGESIPVFKTVTPIILDGRKHLIDSFIDITERKRMEEALRESEERFALAVQGSNDGIWDWDIVNHTLYWSPRMKELLGYAGDELDVNYDTFESHLHPADREHIKAAIEAHLKNGGLYDVEQRLRTKSGEYRWFHARGQTLWDEEGNPIRMIGSTTDITERKQMEEKLRLLSSSVEQSSEGMAMVDLEGNLLFANNAFATLHGYTSEELVGKHLSIFHTPEQMPSVEAANQQLQETGEFSGEIWHVRRDGTVFPTLMHNSVLQDEAGNATGMIGTLRDITELKVAEEALREKEQRYRTLAESSPDAIFILDRDERMIYGNQTSAQWLSRPVAELVGQRPADLFPAETARHQSEALQRVLVTGEAERQEEPIPFPGGVRWMEFRLLPLPSPNGAIESVMGVSRDITEPKQAEEKLKQTLAELERSNQELEQFAYVASHDLQEPLRMVSSYTQLLARRYQGQLDADANEFIAFAVDGANRMQRLINDLLTYSRVGTHGKGFQPTDCMAVLDQALANLKAAIEQSGAVVTHDPLPTVMADNLQLVQLFQNLIGNAIKFHGEEPPHVHVSAEQKGKEWVFSVRDNGIGIDPRYAERIFILFQRLHTREEYPGTGIGLAICKKIAERHGGRIWVESQPGIGSTFYFTIPTGGNGP